MFQIVIPEWIDLTWTKKNRLIFVVSEKKLVVSLGIFLLVITRVLSQLGDFSHTHTHEFFFQEMLVISILKRVAVCVCGASVDFPVEKRWERREGTWKRGTWLAHQVRQLVIRWGPFSSWWLFQIFISFHFFLKKSSFSTMSFIVDLPMTHWLRSPIMYTRCV